MVREDSALAYKLQSQESKSYISHTELKFTTYIYTHLMLGNTSPTVNDFYKGNRQRNAVVREDFPTALNEQIKEKEEAEKQVEMYRRRLLEQ